MVKHGSLWSYRRQFESDILYFMRFIDLTGKRFGKLTVLERAPKQHYKGVHWICQCECGNTAIVSSSDLKSGSTNSCGCLRKERMSEYNKINRTKHGKSHLKIYDVWYGMIKRCTNADNKDYPRYGGRGVKVFDEWLNFESFYEWSMSNGYKEDLELDRINNDGNYEPSNCKWVTRKIQNNNRCNNKYVEYNGEIHTIAEWSEILHLPYDTVRTRIRRGQCINKVRYKHE